MRILITSDGSPLAERALAALAPWVQGWSAETWLLTVVDPRESHETLAESGRPVAPASGMATTPALGGVSISRPATLSADRSQALEAARTSTEDGLRDLAARALPGAAVRVHAEFSDDSAKAIVDFAGTHAFDFIVMSTHGRSGLGRALLGSVASAVVRHATVPVIVVGPEVGLPAAP
jgi:nucleotide-binding universal stress UspA family protein